MPEYDTSAKYDYGSEWNGDGWITNYSRAELFHIVGAEEKGEAKDIVRSVLDSGLKPQPADRKLYVRPQWLKDERLSFFSPMEESLNWNGIKLRVSVPTENLWVDVLSEQFTLREFLYENENYGRMIYGDNYETAVPENMPAPGVPEGHVAVKLERYKPLYEEIGDKLYQYIVGLFVIGETIDPSMVEVLGWEEL